MKVRIFAAMHGRHDSFQIFKAGVDRLRKNFDCDVFMVCTTVDDANLLRLMEIPYVVADNHPVSDKHNAGLRGALADGDWTHLLIMGSDDVITNEGFDLLCRLNPRHAGFYGGLFYDLRNDRCKHWDYPRDLSSRRLFGAGRMLSRELIEYVFDRSELLCKLPDGNSKKGDKLFVPRPAVDYLCASKRWEKTGKTQSGLWPEGLHKGLDWGMEDILVVNGAAPQGISGIHVCDFKTSDNLWKYEDKGGEAYSFSEFASRLSDTERELINRLTKTTK